MSLFKKPKHLHRPSFDRMLLPFRSTEANTVDTVDFLQILGAFNIDVCTIIEDPEKSFVLIGEQHNLDRFAEYWAKRGLYAPVV